MKFMIFDCCTSYKHRHTHANYYIYNIMKTLLFPQNILNTGLWYIKAL